MMECSILISGLLYINFFSEFCINNGDYNGTLEYVNVWGIKLKLTCKQLVEWDSSLCRNDSVRRHCCSSCSNVKMVEGELIIGIGK